MTSTPLDVGQDTSRAVSLPSPRSDQSNDCTELTPIIESVIYRSSYAWLIQNFDFESIAESRLESPTFSMSGKDELTWRLILDDVSDKSNLLRLRVKLQSCNYVRANYRLAILNAEGKTCREGSLATMYASGESRSAVAIIPLDYLRGQARVLLASGALRLLCEINARPEAPRPRLATDLAELLASERFSDVKLVCGPKVFPAHKSILAARSRVFAAMLEHDMIESNESVIQVEDFEPGVMKALLDFIYTERADQRLAKDLFRAADKYALEELRDACEDALCFGLDVDNAMEMLILADMHSAERLKERARRFAVDNAVRVMETKAYKEAGEAQLHLLGEVITRIE